MKFQVKLQIKKLIDSFIQFRTLNIIIFVGFLLVAFLLLSYFLPVQKEALDFNNTNASIPKITLDCMTCHSAGTISFKANETIKLNTCNECHKEGIEFLVTVNYTIHKFHQGNISNLPPANYIERHTEIIISCDSCHIFAPDKVIDCKVCHKGNSHVNKDVVCSKCHGYINEIFKHNTIKLYTHDKFGNKSCTVMCHSEDKVSLRLFNNIPVAITNSVMLCKQCHSGIYRDWTENKHYANQTCVDCHNPHNPKINQTTGNYAYVQ